MLFYPLLVPALVGWPGSRRRHWRTSPTGERKHECRDRHADCCENAHDRYPLLTEECANALSQRSVFMEEPPDGPTNSVNLGPESCFVHGEGFEPRFQVRGRRARPKAFSFDLEYLVEFRCRPFPSVFGAPWPSASRLRISVRRHLTASPGCYRAHLSFSSWPPLLQHLGGLGDPRDVHLRVLDGLQCGLDVSSCPNDVVGRAGDPSARWIQCFWGGSPLHSGAFPRPLCRAHATPPVYNQ